MFISELGEIKLIIWDLDETFWPGILSEGTHQYSQDNHHLIQDLAKRGVMSSICSNNNFDDVKSTLLSSGLWDFIVFPQASWERKGPMVKSIISGAQLRPENVLFIDDQPSNLHEAKSVSLGLLCAGPDVIPIIKDHVVSVPENDFQLDRLKQYQLLERKTVSRSAGIDPTEFLRASDICVTFHDPLQHIDRIHELLSRTNQLNFTKQRVSLSDLRSQLVDHRFLCRAIRVEDKYGDYGTTGFYALSGKGDSTRLEHFLFSCRLLNMGIEQWVYRLLGYPRTFDNRLLSDLHTVDALDWIADSGTKLSGIRRQLFMTGEWLWRNLPALRPALDYASRKVFDSRDQDPNNSSQIDPDVLLKGGCTVEMLHPYLANACNLNISTEVGEWAPSIALLRATLDRDNQEISDDLASISQWCDDSLQSLLDRRIPDVCVLDLAKDLRANYYRLQGSSLVLPIAPLGIDLCNHENRLAPKRYRSNRYSGPWWNSVYSSSGLRWLAVHCEVLSEADFTSCFLSNLDWVCSQFKTIAPGSNIIVIDHSSTMPRHCEPVWAPVSDRIFRLKSKIREVVDQHDHVSILDFDDIISAPDDFFDGNPFHYRRFFRYEAANRLVARLVNSGISENSRSDVDLIDRSYDQDSRSASSSS